MILLYVDVFTIHFISLQSNDISWDMAAAKGVVYTKIVKNVGGFSVTYNVMGTHLIFDSKNLETRPNQVREWKKYADEKHIPADEALIYVGDFNEGESHSACKQSTRPSIMSLSTD